MSIRNEKKILRVIISLISIRSKLKSNWVLFLLCGAAMQIRKLSAVHFLSPTHSDLCKGETTKRVGGWLVG